MVNSRTEPDVYIGKFLNNRYLIIDLIGKGGMGRVYLAEDTAKGGKQVALKILMLSLANQQLSQRFAREIFIGAQLGRKSKHIVRVLSYGVTDDKTPFYVMEYLQGKNLKQILKAQALTIGKFLDISYQICLGLECAHQGITLKGEIYPIVHRDIKPENIFLTTDTQKNELVKILDFGIAKFLTERSGMTLTDSFIGSLPYCSPEHMEGRKLLDVRSDIYSLGVLMFEMLTAKHPFQTQSNSFGNWYQAHRFQTPPALTEVDTQLKIPQELQELVMNCLAKEVGDRPQNIHQILQVLEQFKNKIETNVGNSDVWESLPTVQLVPVTSISEKECLQKTWPKNKPIQTIGFPHLLHTTQGIIPTYWAMLPKQEIVSFLSRNHSTEFMQQISAYPMILWVTVLYDSQLSLIRWLSSFIDLNGNKGQKLVQTLADTGYYHLLFFALEEPNNCAHVITLTLNAKQRQQLLNCLKFTQNAQGTASIKSEEAKAILRVEYEKIKLEIMQNLVANKSIDRFYLKNWLAQIIENFMQLFRYKNNK
ncbi:MULTISPECIES: serine/threonine-protein kinase [unclassified Anabaena]|uniref:serine/threonine protein kinase n=1 Tax=unclassified Anabaena TaxID=2619674 RepID=UPI002B202FEC|nr:serine/threonine-protein kinase [Anabaena sp. UHCC 0399]MEA5567755.1 serine/threonine-protein kinase [Anabaena sp. UHCC 0399]